MNSRSNPIGKVIWLDGAPLKVINLRLFKGSNDTERIPDTAWPEGWDEPDIEPGKRPYNEAWSGWMNIWNTRQDSFVVEIQTAKSHQQIDRIMARVEREALSIFVHGRFEKRPISFERVATAARKRKAELEVKHNKAIAVMNRGQEFIAAKSRKELAALERIGFIIVLTGVSHVGEKVADGKVRS